MRTINRILVPIDFSPCSERAFRYALLLADQFGAEVRSLHCLNPVYDIPEMPAYSQHANERMLAQTEKDLMDFQSRVSQEVTTDIAQLPPLFIDVEMGPVRPVVQRVAKERNCDLIVMGTEGAHNRFSEIWGTNAAAVIDEAPCPVLIIPNETIFKDPQVIGVAGAAAQIDLAFLARMMNQLKPTKPLIRCVHIKTPKNETCLSAFAELETRYEWGKYDFDMTFHEVEAPSVRKGLLDSSDRFKLDWLVLFRPQRGGLEKLFHHSQTRVAALCSHCPLLIIPEPSVIEGGEVPGHASTAIS